MLRNFLLFPAIVLLVWNAAARGQDNTLDVLDGETLYKGGWLFTSSYRSQWEEGLQRGTRRVADPMDQRRVEQEVAIAGHYGLRQDLQLTAIVPYVRKELLLRDPAGPDRFVGEGLGDSSLIAKWRFYRWDAPHETLNVAALFGLELPTGKYRESDRGMRLPPDLQPGSGSWDPSAGLAATYEPGRWRFSSAVLYKDNRPNSSDYRFGDQLFVELEAGNRFWLEPYPGPFMRLDLTARYYHEGRSEQDGHIDHASGHRRATVGATLAFRPRPSLDLQIGGEVPVYQSLLGTQIEYDGSLFVALGLRF